MKKTFYTALLLWAVGNQQTALAQTVEPVVGWSSWVDWPNRTADQGITGNINVTVLNTVGANTPTFTDADGSGQRAMADGWAGGANSKAWTFNFKTTKYRTLKFAGKLMGTNSPNPFYGPRDFKLQYSLNNSTWTDVSGGTMTAYNGYNGAAGWNSYANIALPAACENQPVVYLRLLMTSNTAVNGQTVGTGQSHFDDVNVTGVSDPEAPTDIALSNAALLVPTATSTTAAGAAVGTFSSVDFNAGNTHTYTLVSGTGGANNGSFGISGNALTTAATLLPGTYSIRVRSTDNSGLWFEKVFTIVVCAPDAILRGTRLRTTSMGTDGNTSFGVQSPVAVSYNSTNNEYLQVWVGDDNTAPLVDNEMEVFAQRINGATGAIAGSRIRVSFMGTNGTTTHRAINPVVAWNATANEYFVVWQGDHNSGSLVAGEDEIWGQRIDGATGLLSGSMVRISTMATDGNNAFDAQNPDVVWNATANQYLVVWRGDDNTSPLVDNEYDVYAQAVTAGGVLSGSRVQVSAMGTAGSSSFNALTPAVNWNATANEYMVVWSGDDNTAPLVDNEFEIFGQRLNSSGALTGSRIRVSSMGTDGLTNFTATTPDVAWSNHANEYMVVWRGDDNTAPLVDNEYEIFGQRVSNTGALTGGRIRISDMGPDGNTAYNASNPKLMYHANLREYWIVWSGDDDVTSVDGENEIFMQRVTAAGAETGTNDVRISYMGTANNTAFTALQPAVAYNSTNITAFAAWQGDDDASPLVDNEMEIFGQSLFITPSTLPVNWLTFTAIRQTDGSVKLNWETAREQNTNYFVVQHGANNQWKAIDTVAAANNGSVARYNTLHKTPAKGINNYRLLQVDCDGKSTYSKTIGVNINAGQLAVYPNPAEKNLNVQLPSTSASTLMIYNSAGVLMKQQGGQGHLVALSLEGLASGQYTVVVLQNDIRYQQTVLKK